MSTSIVNKEPNTGRFQKEDNTTANIADIIAAALNSVNTQRCSLVADGTITNGIVIPTNASSYNITKTGDDISLGENAAEFNGNTRLNFYINGHLQTPIIDVVFVTAYSFYLATTLNQTDTVTIIREG